MDNNNTLKERVQFLEDLAEENRSEYEKLWAENERLRKAGDAMDAYLKRQDGTTNGMLDCRVEWLNAKGVQS